MCEFDYLTRAGAAAQSPDATRQLARVRTLSSDGLSLVYLLDYFEHTRCLHDVMCVYIRP